MLRDFVDNLLGKKQQAPKAMPVAQKAMPMQAKAPANMALEVNSNPQQGQAYRDPYDYDHLRPQYAMGAPSLRQFASSMPMTGNPQTQAVPGVVQYGNNDDVLEPGNSLKLRRYVRPY